MNTEAEFRPQIVPGGGRDSRISRRKREMESLWTEAWEAADSGDRELAEELFMEANALGMSLPTEENRFCRVTGTVALGHARLPFTRWAADIAVSHGRDEQRPTPLDRYVGWDERDVKTGVLVKEHQPLRTTLRLTQMSGRPVIRMADAMGLVAALGLDRDGAQVRVEYNRDGVVELHPETVGVGPDTAGPQPVAD